MRWPISSPAMKILGFTTPHSPSLVNLLKQLCCDMGRSGVTVDDSIRCFGPLLPLLPYTANVGMGKTKHTTFIRNFFHRFVSPPGVFPSLCMSQTKPLTHIVFFFVALSGPHRWISICTPDLPPPHSPSLPLTPSHSSQSNLFEQLCCGLGGSDKKTYK